MNEHKEAKKQADRIQFLLEMLSAELFFACGNDKHFHTDFGMFLADTWFKINKIEEAFSERLKEGVY